MEKHRKRGKMTARERIERLIDADSYFLEIGLFAANLPQAIGGGGLDYAAMRLVEVVRTPLVDPQVYADAIAFAEGLDKEAVPCPDTPGFLVNRVLVPMLNDAVRTLAETGADPGDIDRALLLAEDADSVAAASDAVAALTALREHVMCSTVTVYRVTATNMPSGDGETTVPAGLSGVSAIAGATGNAWMWFTTAMPSTPR